MDRIGQEHSGLLAAASILLAAEDWGKPFTRMDFRTYLEHSNDLPEQVDSADDYDLIQRQLGTDKLNPRDIEEVWNEFYSGDMECDVPEFEFPEACLKCEKDRMEDSIFCAECHPEMDAS